MTILTLALLFFVQLGFLKQLLKQGRLFESCIIFCIPFLIFFCKKHKNSSRVMESDSRIWFGYVKKRVGITIEASEGVNLR